MERTVSYREAMLGTLPFSHVDIDQTLDTISTTSHEPVTIRIKRYVTPGREEEYKAFVARLAKETREFPGFLGVSIIHPDENAEGSVWNIFIKFASYEDSERWFQSERRQLYAHAIETKGIVNTDPSKFSVDFNRGWMTRYVADTSLQLLQRSDIEPVTVVVARRIKPELGHVYQNWVVGVAAAAETFAGNLGTSLILPGEGDNRWVLLYRYNSLANLEAWHSSEQRATLLKQLDALGIVETAAEYETQSGWNSFFTTSTKTNRPPPKYRMIVIVLIAVWLSNTLFGFQSKDGSIRSLSPAIGHAVDLKDNPERLPVVVLLSALVSIPILFFGVVPLMARAVQPWLTQPVPKRPSPGWRRWVYDIVV
eukprot:m.31321 g.31321  ORF g.31321 m.31321 type:complete len:367 (-) comp12058_c0_seq2:45-1145(-)